MPRLLSALMILAVFSMCLPSDGTNAQESKQSCNDCPHTQKTANTHEFEFNLPGIDFPMGVHIAVEKNDAPGNHGKVEGSIEIECECLNLSGVPFLSNVPMMGTLFTNVDQPPHPPCCAITKTESCEGQCCALDSDAGSNSCKACGQDAKCEKGDGKCDGCPSAKTGFAIKGADRLFTTSVAATSNSCPACKQTAECPKCEGCPAACPGKAIQAKGPQDVQLVTYVETGASKANSPRSEFNEEVFELRLENERLKMEVEAADHRLEMMEAMMELREENAILRTQVEFFKAHRTHAAPATHSTNQAK